MAFPEIDDIGNWTGVVRLNRKAPSEYRRRLDEVFSLVFIGEQRLHFGAQAVVVAARLRQMGSP
jgi:hypothetical protein